MKDIFMLIRRFIAPYYKGYLSLAVLFNILSALLNLVAFALVMPILNILFQIEERVTTYIPFSSLDLTTQAGWSQMKEVVTNNFGYFVSQLIETEGASYTLIILGIYLVLMTLLKVGATYLGGLPRPIRTGSSVTCAISSMLRSLPCHWASSAKSARATCWLVSRGTSGRWRTP